MTEDFFDEHIDFVALQRWILDTFEIRANVTSRTTSSSETNPLIDVLIQFKSDLDAERVRTLLPTNHFQGINLA